MAPESVMQWLGQDGLRWVQFALGLGFGSVLEISGFGDSRRLAAQFYGTEMRVLKVMFTAIVTAMLLIFASSALGLLDFGSLWVNPTYLVGGIVGGLVMGVGFVIGGYCPGTSLVSMSTLKVDGAFFVLGVSLGIFAFGETVDSYRVWFEEGGGTGRFTLFQWLKVDAGVVVLGVVVMATAMFKGAEWAEARWGKEGPGTQHPHGIPRLPWWGVAVMVAIAVGTIVVGQPGTEKRWQRMQAVQQPRIDAGALHIMPSELVSAWYNDQIRLQVLDLRSESQWNRIHLAHSTRLQFTPDQAEQIAAQMRLQAPNTLRVIISETGNDSLTLQTLRTLLAWGVPNVYVLEGGMQAWETTWTDHLQIASDHGHVKKDNASHTKVDTRLDNSWLGGRHPLSLPPRSWLGVVPFTPKVKMELKGGNRKGGCG